jgi:hypothetical protein
MHKGIPPLCERCWQPVRSSDEFIRLGHITDVRTNGEPVYLWSYLHAYDAHSGGCVGVSAAAA